MVTDSVRQEEHEEAEEKEAFDQEIRELSTAKVPSYEVTIWMGLKEGYEGPVHKIKDVDRLCQWYVDKVGLCVTVEETHFIYAGGAEPGARIGLINYPRFPSKTWTVRMHAFTLAKHLMHQLKQERCSVVCPDFTYMLESLYAST